MLFSHPDVNSSIVWEGFSSTKSHISNFKQLNYDRCCMRAIGGEDCCAVRYTNGGENDAYIGLTPNFPSKVR